MLKTNIHLTFTLFLAMLSFGNFELLNAQQILLKKADILYLEGLNQQSWYYPYYEKIPTIESLDTVALNLALDYYNKVEKRAIEQRDYVHAVERQGTILMLLRRIETGKEKYQQLFEIKYLWNYHTGEEAFYGTEYKSEKHDLCLKILALYLEANRSDSVLHYTERLEREFRPSGFCGNSHRSFVKRCVQLRADCHYKLGNREEAIRQQIRFVSHDVYAYSEEDADIKKLARWIKEFYDKDSIETALRLAVKKARLAEEAGISFPFFGTYMELYHSLGNKKHPQYSSQRVVRSDCDSYISKALNDSLLFKLLRAD